MDAATTSIVSGSSRDATGPPQSSVLDRPIPMSMPSILINPRQRQLAPQVHQPPRSYSTHTTTSDARVGHRRLRRNENSA